MQNSRQNETRPNIPLNFQESIFLPSRPRTEGSSNQLKWPFLVKTWPQQKNDEDRLKNNRASSYMVQYRSEKVSGQILYKSELQQMSLETFIQLHKQRECPIDTPILKSFARTYDNLNKLIKSNMMHGNLKPSNIMIRFPEQYVDKRREIDVDKIEWKLSEVGINLMSQNKFYSKSRLIMDNGSRSIKLDSMESDFYSLGVILLEMATLFPIQKIHNDIATGKISEQNYYDYLKKKGLGSHFNNTDLFDFIRALIRPEIMNNGNIGVALNRLYKNYSENKDRDRDIPQTVDPQIDYSNFLLSSQNIQRFLAKNTVQLVINKIKDNIQKQEDKCSQVLKRIIKELDPEEEFFFPTHSELITFIKMYDGFGNKRQNEELLAKDVDILLFAKYFTSESRVYYMPIMMRIFEPADLAECLIKKAIDQYESSSEFFRDQTNEKDSWKAGDILIFFRTIKVPFSKEQIQKILRAWAPNNKDATINALKLDEFKKIFKDYSSPKKNDKLSDNQKKAQQRLQKVVGMFKQLLRKKDNLVSYFRGMKGQDKWQVHIDVVKEEIRKYYKFTNSYEEKQILNELLVMGRLSENDRKIDYIRVLKKIGIYEPIELFRKVIVQRINEDGIATIYKKYENDEKGWNFASLQQFCTKEYLDFDEKYQRMFFDRLDKDDSGFINLKELTFKLTGIKQFDMELIVETIKNSSMNDGDHVFNAFLKVDDEKAFSFASTNQLAQAFEIVDRKLKFEKSHIEQIYSKFSTRKGKFDYLGFMRYFCDLCHIFVKSCNVLIDLMYKGNFESFFKIGLKGEEIKWKRQSVGRVNDKLVLGFKDKELDEVWKKLDTRNQISLSMQEVGQRFTRQVQRLEEFKARAVESLDDFSPKKKLQEFNKNITDDRNRIDSRQTIQSNRDGNIQKNQLVLELKSIKLKPILAQCYKNSQQKGFVWIESEKFCSILKDEKINCTKKFLQTSFPFCLKKTSAKNLFNFLKFFLVIAQFKKDSFKEKTQCLRYMLANACKQKKIKVSILFQDFRVRDQMMKLSKFQLVVKDVLNLVDDELFFDDINDVWSFFGDPHYITIKNFEKILDEDDIERLRDFVKDQKEEKSGFDSRDRPTPSLRNRKQSEYDKKRKQSEDEMDWKRRDQKQRGRKDSQREQKKFDSERRLQEKQSERRDYDRERNEREKQREKQRERQLRQRQREREEQKERQRKNEQRRRKKSEDQERRDDRRVDIVKTTSMEDTLYDKREKEREKQSQFTKKQLLANFQKQLQQKSVDDLVKLFSTKNKIKAEVFAICLSKYYDFGKKEAVELSDYFADFGQVKVETVKKYMRSAEKSTEKREEGQRYSRDKKNVEFDERSPNRFDDKMVTPVTKAIQPQFKLSNPHKRKLNVPLIKEQIKMLVRSFGQKYAVEELEKYFFDDSEVIYRDEFLKKCKAINSSLTEQNIEKMFEFLKPNEREEVSIMNFKISFTFEQNMEVQEEYLPKQLIKQLQEIFNAHDKDKSGSIEPGEIEALLATLGFNQTQKEIENVFQKIDKNFDNQVSFSEFKDFIEDFILPHLVEFQNDVDELFTMLKMNDIFNTGCVSLSVLLIILERLGVKLTNQEGVFLAKYIGNDNDQIPIYDFLAALYHSSNPIFPPLVKSALYKIKLKRKISLKQIQKTFSNISSNFVMAYTSRLIKSQQLKRSSAFQPILHQSYMFYQDFFYKDFRRIHSSKNDKVLIDEDPRSATALVEIRIPEAAGVPIPQNASIKGAILKRSMNVSFFDMSAQTAKICIITLEADWDAQIEDQWVFDARNRGFYIKIANYDAKKFDKIILLFELVITMNDNGRVIEVSCGSASISVKELVSVESKLSKKLKLLSGIPTKAKQIDKVSVTKRTGWKNFLGSSSTQSELSIEIIHQKNMDAKTTVPMLHALPSVCLVKRKGLHYIWAFREYFAQRCVDKDCINPEFINHHTVRAFMLSMDIEEVSSQVMGFWRQKIEQFWYQCRQQLKTVWQSRVVMYNLLSDLQMIFNSKQFELKLSNPCGSVGLNKNLVTLRQKMVGEVLENIESYVKNELLQGKGYKRVKNYSYNYWLMAEEYGKGSLQKYINENVIKVGRA